MTQTRTPTKSEKSNTGIIKESEILKALNFPALVFDFKTFIVKESNSYFNNEYNTSILELLSKYDYGFIDPLVIKDIILSLGWGNNYFENKSVYRNKKLFRYAVFASTLSCDNDVMLYINLITDHKKPERQIIYDIPNYQEEIFQNLSEGLCEINELYFITYCNKPFATIFERVPYDMIGENFLNFVGSDNMAAIREEIEIKNFSLNTSLELKLKINNQKDKIIQVRSFPRLSHNNQYVGTFLLLSDLTERQLIENELLFTKEKAKETDNLKSSFLANVPHEIRTPMNSIMGFASILKRPGLTRKKRQQYLDIIITHGNKLMEILNDIIDLTIIEENHLQLNSTICSLNTIFSEVIRTGYQSIEKLNKSIEIKFLPDLTDVKSVILIDGDRIKQILNKLISNSIKFTESGYIEIGYRLENIDTIVCYVKDTGIGIPPEFHKTIFGQFRQIDESFTRNYGGTGVGLTICKGLVKLFGGNIWVESDGINGTTIFFTIPYYPFNEFENQVTSNISDIDSASWEGKKVLLIEDDQASSEYLSEILLSKHCQVLNASNGIMALDCFKSDLTISMILLDIQLPDLDGYAIAKEIRKLNASVPIIAQTAHSRVEDKLKCFEAGCNEYIAKPISYELFLNTVQKYFIPEIS